MPRPPPVRRGIFIPRRYFVQPDCWWRSSGEFENDGTGCTISVTTRQASPPVLQRANFLPPAIGPRHSAGGQARCETPRPCSGPTMKMPWRMRPRGEVLETLEDHPRPGSFANDNRDPLLRGLLRHRRRDRRLCVVTRLTYFFAAGFRWQRMAVQVGILALL